MVEIEPKTTLDYIVECEPRYAPKADRSFSLSFLIVWFCCCMISPGLLVSNGPGLLMADPRRVGSAGSPRRSRAGSPSGSSATAVSYGHIPRPTVHLPRGLVIALPDPVLGTLAEKSHRPGLILERNLGALTLLRHQHIAISLEHSDGPLLFIAGS
jgi:hypothetical protein